MPGLAAAAGDLDAPARGGLPRPPEQSWVIRDRFAAWLFFRPGAFVTTFAVGDPAEDTGRAGKPGRGRRQAVRDVGDGSPVLLVHVATAPNAMATCSPPP